MIASMPPLNERQLPAFRESLGKWVSNIIHRRRPTGLAYDLSRAHELATSEPLEDRSIYVDLGNLRGLSATTQNLGGYLIGTELSEIKQGLYPYNAVMAAGAQVEQRQGNLAVRRVVTIPRRVFSQKPIRSLKQRKFTARQLASRKDARSF